MGFCHSKEEKCVTPATGALISASIISDETVLDSESYADIQRYYAFKRVLGHGQFGTVREAIRLGGASDRVAIKSMRKEAFLQSIALIKHELSVIRRLDHPNIVKFYETYEDAKYLHIVMELCEGGDLFDYVTGKEGLTEEEVKTIMRKLMHGVNHMHGLQICHRDLKPENFLYTSQSSGADVKIVDFGMSRRFSREEQMTTVVGTPYYIAPEVIVGCYTKECDVWSLGAVMFFLLSGEQPFASENINDLYFKISNGHYTFDNPAWTRISSAAKSLVSSLLTTNVASRIRLESALRHPWFHSSSSSSAISSTVLSSLRSYKAPRRLQKEIIQLVVKHLSHDEIQELRVPITQHAFLAIDKDRTGFITAADLEETMVNAGLNISQEEVRQICERIRCPALGKIKYSDFLNAAFDRKRLLDEELLYMTFHRFDVVRYR